MLLCGRALLGLGYSTMLNHFPRNTDVVQSLHLCSQGLDHKSTRNGPLRKDKYLRERHVLLLRCRKLEKSPQRLSSRLSPPRRPTGAAAESGRRRPSRRGVEQRHTNADAFDVSCRPDEATRFGGRWTVANSHRLDFCRLFV